MHKSTVDHKSRKFISNVSKMYIQGMAILTVSAIMMDRTKQMIPRILEMSFSGEEAESTGRDMETLRRENGDRRTV